MSPVLSTCRIFLKFNETGTVTGHFSVASSEIPGTVSIITVTAQSETQTQSVNSAISQFLVLPLVSIFTGSMTNTHTHIYQELCTFSFLAPYTAISKCL